MIAETQPNLGQQATPIEAVCITLLCFGWFILASISAVLAGFPSGRFSNAEFMGLVAHELIVGAVAIAILRHRGHKLSDLLPTPSLKGCGIGIGLYLAAMAAGWIEIIVFSNANDPRPIEQTLAGAAVSMPFVVIMAMVNGLYEETFLLGYLLRGFRSHGASFAMSLSLLVRVLYHLYQGPVGALWVLVVGAIFSTYYLRTRNLWPVVFAHTLADIIPFS